MQRTIFYPSPFGTLRLKYNNDAILSIERSEVIEDDDFIVVRSDTELIRETLKQLDEYFAGTRKSFDFAYELNGTDFQKKVWKALCDIPYGETRSYQDIAKAVGNPKASRAVGLANNKNPIAIAVPCHRVIASDGKLTGYAGGLEMKQGLLDLEAGKAKL